MNSRRINIWLCNFFVLMFTLIFFGVSQSFAQQDSVYFNPKSLSGKYAFQWNVMASPAVFTGSDKAEEGRFATGIAISPDLKFISIPNTATVITSNAAKGVYIEVPQKMVFGWWRNKTPLQ